MSRSYKKHPWATDNSDKKIHKKIANRRVRRFNRDIANGKAYRKLYESWEICDWKWLCENPEEEKDYKSWYKYFKRK